MRLLGVFFKLTVSSNPVRLHYRPGTTLLLTNRIFSPQVHIAASECLLELIKLYRDFPLEERREAKFEGELIQLCESEKSEQAKALLKQCFAALKELTGVTMTMG